MSAPSIRARVRAEMTEEIKAVARRHLATEGGNLSLRAVARDLGMVSSAVYRYFPSRDALLTVLIVEAYQALGDAAEAGDAAVDRHDLRGRWLGVSHAVRAWSLAHPAEYALLYGSPVPGYAAPAETVVPAQRVVYALVEIMVDGAAAGRLAPPDATPVPPPVRADLARLLQQRPGVLTEEQLVRCMAAWSQLFGLVSFEVFGRLAQGVVEDYAAYFDHQMRLMADLAGLPDEPDRPDEPGQPASEE
ncbi:TetR family transcriptional regulator [Plantactinospora sp. BC1]|uniref:TetR/AcrR family transcriptional regulator n=1 Tax=Plantactinospora sp. BC1 TaxID=2108470 RepID=UPI000D17DC9B|nr:TetR/AcrR family transcriptional regulator [Plantactinospora sp. BC1]AVT35079.1 TetR family transcriptional regulator [Plantactinospora sp. BC1]